MAVDSSPGDASSTPFLDTVEGEISFFRSLMRARPVGLHRHFHVLSMRNAIHQDTGQYVAIDDIWAKLRSCYDMDTLENLEAEGYESPGSSSSTPQVISSPSPSDNLTAHPFFRKEFMLPEDLAYETMQATRRLRSTAEPPSPSEPSPARPTRSNGTGGRGRKRGRGNVNLAGLVGGESDSSDLTQESGDESVAPTPRESVVTGTDAGTDYADVEEEETAASPAPSVSSKPTRGRGGKATRRGGAGRGRAAGSGPGRGKRRKRQ